MKSRSLLLILAVAVLNSGFSPAGAWLITTGSRLTVLGSTNINTFACTINYQPGADTLAYFHDASTRRLSFTKGRMRLPVRAFDCGARQISSDFRKTLKCETYPHLDIEFKSLDNFLLNESHLINGLVDITIAGKTVSHTISYRVHRKPDTSIVLVGRHKVCFSDFGLTAPQKLNGLIKVNEALDVEFNLLLEEI